MIHRDLKPSNILVTRATTTTGEPQPKILDFGIARSTDADMQLSTMQTSTGQLLGTLPYMSPEQVLGSRSEIDARSDLYSLGVILYELLAGRLPLELEGRSLTEIARIVKGEDPTLLGRVDRDLRGDVETICEKALSKERERRYASAAELADDLRRFLRNEPIAARPPTTWYQLQKFARRNRALVAGVAATMLALAVGLVLTSVYAARANRLAAKERIARQKADRLATSERVAREKANRLAEREEVAREKADALANQFRQALYRAEMRAAGEALHSIGGLARIQQLLPRWVPGKGEPDLRGWEWHMMHAHARVGPSISPPHGFLEPLYWDANDELIACTTFKKRHGYAWHIGPVDLATGDPRSVIAKTDIMMHERSPDRKRIAVRTRRAVRVCAYPSGRQESTWRTDGSPQMCGWSPDGALLAVTVLKQVPKPGKSSTHVVVRRVDTGAEVAKLDVQSQWHHHLIGFSPDGSLLASDAGFESPAGVVLFRTSDWQRDRLLTGNGRASILRWHPTRPWLAVGFRNGDVRIYDGATGDVVVPFAGHRRHVSAMNWSADGLQLATGSQNGTVRVWNVATGRGRLVGSQRHNVLGLCWSADGTRIATGVELLTIWNLDRKLAVRTLVEPGAHGRGVSRLTWHPDGKRLAFDVSGTTKILDTRSGALLEEVRGDWLAFSSDGTRIAVRQGRKIVVRSTDDDPRILLERPCEEGNGWHLKWRPGSHAFAYACRGFIGIWEPDKTEPRIIKTGTARTLDWSPHDDSLWFGSWSGKPTRIDPDGGDRVAHEFVGRFTSVCFDPTRPRMAFGIEDRSVIIWNPQNGKRSRTLHGHADRVDCVAWHPNGTRLASGGADATVRVWDVESGTEVIVLKHDQAVYSVAWSPDGSTLASSTADGRVTLWQAAAPE